MTTQKRAVLAVYIVSSVLWLHGVTNTTIAYIIDSYAGRESVLTVQQLVSLPAIFGLIVSFLIGFIALKINKKYLTIFCALMIFVYFCLFAFIGENGPFSLLLLATGFAGIAQGSAITLLASMLGEFVGPEKSAGAIAISSAVMNAGQAFIAVVGGAIAAGNGGADWPKAYYLGALVIPAIIIFGILMPKKPDAQEAELQAKSALPGEAAILAVKERLPLKVIVISALLVFVFIFISGFVFYVSVYIVNEFKLGTTVEVGIANSIFMLTGVVTGFTYAIWAKLFKKLLVVVGYTMITLALFSMMTFTTTLLGVYLAAFLTGWGLNMVNPYTMGFIMQITPPRLAPVGISISLACANVGMFVPIYTLTFLSNLLGGGIKNVLLICTVGMAISIVVGYFVFRVKNGPSTAPVEAKSA
jgi:MFS family permease